MNTNRVLRTGMVLSLTIAIMASSLTGCTSSKSASAGSTESQALDTAVTSNISYPLSKTPVTMSMFIVVQDATTDMKNQQFFKDMEAKTNIKWNLTQVASDVATEKRGLLLASGDYPDVFFRGGLSASEEAKYGTQGILIPLNKLINQYAPTLKNLLATNKQVKGDITTPSGSIYALPEVDRADPQLQIFYNKKWADKLNIKAPQNADDYYNMLKAFKTGDPNGNGKADEIPLTFLDSSMAFRFTTFFGLNCDYATMLATDKTKVVFVPTADQYKQSLLYLKKLYSEGLLDKNAFTQGHDQQNAAGAQTPMILGSFFDADAFLTAGAATDRNGQYTVLIPPKATNGVQLWSGSDGVSNGTFAITDKCKNPKLAIQWADYFYTKAGGAYTWMGKEGQSYKMNADGTWDWILSSGASTATVVRRKYTIQGVANHPAARDNELWFKLNDPLEKLVNARRDVAHPYLKVAFPVRYVADADQTQINTISADVMPYIKQFAVKGITGALDINSQWDTYLSTLKKMGSDTYVSLYQKSYDNYETNLKK